MPVKTGAKEWRPVEWLHGIQCIHYVPERIPERLVAPILNSEKAAGEIIQRTLIAGQFPDLGVSIQPDQFALAVVILGALPRYPPQGPALRDDRLVGGVLERSPAAPDSMIIKSGSSGEPIAHLRDFHQARSRSNHMTPIAGRPFVNP